MPQAPFHALLEADPGKFNVILTNGHISFVFIHHRPFYVLHREKKAGDVALVSTLKLTAEEEWVKFDVKQGKKAKMLVFNGPMLILNGDIPS